MSKEKDRSKRRAKVYDKYQVIRSVGGNILKDDKDKPILKLSNEPIKTNIVITPEMAEQLNSSWDSVDKPLSYYYKEVKPAKSEKDELYEKAKSLGLEVDKRMGVEKLKELIKEKE